MGYPRPHQPGSGRSPATETRTTQGVDCVFTTACLYARPHKCCNAHGRSRRRALPNGGTPPRNPCPARADCPVTVRSDSGSNRPHEIDPPDSSIPTATTRSDGGDNRPGGHLAATCTPINGRPAPETRARGIRSPALAAVAAGADRRRCSPRYRGTADHHHPAAGTGVDL